MYIHTVSVFFLKTNICIMPIYMSRMHFHNNIKSNKQVLYLQEHVSHPYAPGTT